MSYNTPIDVIEQLRLKISTYITANSREWSGFSLNIDKMEFQNALHLIVAIERKSDSDLSVQWRSVQSFSSLLDRPNWQDWGGRWTRRTAFMRHLKTILEELDVNYTMPVQPILLPTSGPPPTSMSHLQPPPPGSNPGAANVDLGNAAGFYPSDVSLVPGRSPQGSTPLLR